MNRRSLFCSSQKYFHLNWSRFRSFPCFVLTTIKANHMYGESDWNRWAFRAIAPRSAFACVHCLRCQFRPNKFNLHTKWKREEKGSSEERPFERGRKRFKFIKRDNGLSVLTHYFRLFRKQYAFWTFYADFMRHARICQQKNHFSHSWQRSSSKSPWRLPLFLTLFTKCHTIPLLLFN